MSRNGIPGIYTPFFRVLWGDGDAPCFYFGKQSKSIYFSFDPFLQTGWCTYPKPFFNKKKGWQYYEGAIFIGNQATGKSKVINTPKILIPDWRKRY